MTLDTKHDITATFGKDGLISHQNMTVNEQFVLFFHWYT